MKYKIRNVLSILLFSIVFISISVSSEIYQCKDNGKLTFQQVQCENETEVRCDLNIDYSEVTNSDGSITFDTKFCHTKQMKREKEAEKLLASQEKKKRTNEAHIDFYRENISQVETTEATNRIYFIKAHLANVFSVISPLKTQVAIFYQSMGELPTNKDDIDLEAFDLAEYKQIESSYFTKEGSIGVQLSEFFGEDKYLELLPKASKNGAFIKWSCSTNISKKYLGISRSRICEYQKR